jgi:hypothetical protein
MIGEGIAKAMSGIGDIVKNSINGVIDTINNGLVGLNSFGDSLEKFSGGKVNVSEIGKIPRFAKGGDFVVPPGYPNDGYLMRVQSGERVTVQTPQQQDNRQINSGNTINYINNGQQFRQPSILGLALNY